jgi:FimV-like protein
VKSELSELDEVEMNALDVPPDSAGGRARAEKIASTKQAEDLAPKSSHALDQEEVDLLYDLDEDLTLTADDVSYDIDDSDFLVDQDNSQNDVEETSALEFHSEPVDVPEQRNSEASDNTEDQMSDLDVASTYDEARTQFELAKVFVDLGDEDGAKKILRELAKSDDIDDDVLSDAIALLDSIDG